MTFHFKAKYTAIITERIEFRFILIQISLCWLTGNVLMEDETRQKILDATTKRQITEAFFIFIFHMYFRVFPGNWTSN
jgi:hypothetical protein